MINNLIGKKFGKLTVIKYCGTNKCRQSTWLCRCGCGKEKIIVGRNLVVGDTKSCGCLKNKIRHGHTTNRKQSKTYMAWKHMKHRCYNKNNPKYKDYGGRGITVCQRWLKPNGIGFLNFLEDIGEIPEGKELDRINNDKLKNGYSPKNCKLSTRKQQCRNMRNNRIIPFNGTKICISALAEKYKIHRDTLEYRLDKLGWSVKKALTTPVKKRKFYKRK